MAYILRDWYGYFSFRKDFRPSYGKLATIGSILPQVPLLGLTALLPKRPELTSLSPWAWLMQLKSLETLTDQIFIFHHPLDQTEERIN